MMGPVVLPAAHRLNARAGSHGTPRRHPGAHPWGTTR